MTEEKKEPMKNKYIFPDILGKAMAKVSMRAQLESAMLSQALLCIGMILMGVYTILYSPSTLFFKAAIVFNIICGMILMSSYLITTFQQYQNHMDVMGMDADAERKEVRKRGNIFKRIKLALAERKLKKAEKQLEKVQEVKEMPKELNKEIKQLTEEEIRENERRLLSEI